MSGLENLLAGKSLVGRYRIEEVIGLGGFAAVYRAADERLGRDVAVKVITLAPPDAQSRERLRERFEHEARAAASLPHHPNVITVHDFGHDDELGLDFLVMELLRGENLAQLFKREGHLGMDVALQILCEAAEGIAVGHAAGIIHRDVKPGNIFLAEPHDDDPFRVVVLDFGIARIATDDEELTRTIGENPLTAAYAAPEQMRGDAHLTCAADVFSLGVMGYQLLTGEKPFASGEGRRLRGRDPVRPIRELAPVSPAVEGVIERAMAEDPAARYADASAFRTALSEAMRTDDRTLLAPAAGLGAAAIADDRTILHTAAAPAPPPVAARSVAPSPAPVAPRPAERAPAAASAPARAVPAPRTRSRAPMFLIALLVLGAIAVGLWAMNRGGDREATAAPRDTRTAGEPLPADGSDADPGTPVTAGPTDAATGNADGSTDANGTDGTSTPPSDNSSSGDDGQPSAAPPSPPAGIEPTPGIAPSPPASPVFAPPSAPPPAPPSTPAPRPRPQQPQPQPRPQQPRPQPKPQQPQPQQPEPQQPEPQPEPAPPPAPTPAPPVIVTPPTVVPAPNPNAPRDTIVIPTSPAEGAPTTAP
jgi:hypothetical protein